MTPLRPDVLVLGGGAAGVGAAVGAARSGARVLLVERYGFLGGMATAAFVGTICGLYLRSTRRMGAWACGGFPREVGERLAAASGTAPVAWTDGLQFLPYAPLALRALLDDLLDEHGVEVLLHTTATRVERDGPRIGAVHLLAHDRPATVVPGAVVDATGVATGAALAGAATLDDEDHQAAAFVFAVDGLPPIDPAALRLLLLREATRAVRAGRLPPDALALSVVPGGHRGHRAWLKLGLRGVTRGGPEELTALERRARREVRAIVAALRDTPGLDALEVTDLAAQVGVRTGRRGRGRVVLEEADVLGARKRPDGVAVGAWPIERWGDDPRPAMGLLPEEEVYEIPAGALTSVNVDGLFLAGRALSASEAAIGSARVVGTCLATGYAAGRLAAAQVAGAEVEATIAHLRREQGTCTT